jgi:hypothetical protein
VDTGAQTPRRSHADARVCCDPRGRHGSLREELAAGVTTAPPAALLPNYGPKSYNAAK